MPVNNWVRSDIERQPAEAMQPVIDPAGWTREEVEGAEDWIYHLSETEIDEMNAAVRGVEQRGLDIKDIRREDFPLPTLGPALADIRHEALEGRGFALVRGLPITQYTTAQAAAAFWGVGTHLGAAVSQNAEGHLLGHVKDLGKDYKDAMVRGYQTRTEMGFHADPCDIVALMCLHPAKSGGASRIASSITLYNVMLARRPDLAKELCWRFYWTRHGEVPAGREPWYRQAVFNFHGGYLTIRGASAHLRKSQAIAGVPPMTAAQIEAVEMFQALARELAADMEFRHGDMQFLNNHVILHTRRAFEDWPEPERKRHLFRLWLAIDDARPLPAEFAEQMEGIQVTGAALTTPLDAV